MSTAPAPATTPAAAPRHDPFYSHEAVSTSAARYITHLFSCPNIPTSSNPSAPRPALAHFIAYSLYRTQLPSQVTTAALLLLSRLKARYPAARGSSGHRLFIAAFMMASKMICDDTYSNHSWTIVGQSLFSLKELNQMEREMLSYLDWKTNVTNGQILDLEHVLAARFSQDGVSSEISIALANASTSNHAYQVALAAAQQHQAHLGHQVINPSAAYPSPPCSPHPSPAHSHSYASQQHHHHAPPPTATASAAASSSTVPSAAPSSPSHHYPPSHSYTVPPYGASSSSSSSSHPHPITSSAETSPHSSNANSSALSSNTSSPVYNEAFTPPNVAGVPVEHKDSSWHHHDDDDDGEGDDIDDDADMGEGEYEGPALSPPWGERSL